MSQMLARLSCLCATLTILYPYGFSQEFAREMQMVFWEKLIAHKETGIWNMWHVFWKELCDWPAAVLSEYWFAFRDTLGRGLMSLLTEDKSWRIDERRDAIVASLPPLILDVCIALWVLVIWEPWYTILRWRLLTGFTIVQIQGVIVGVGGLWALKNRIPAWGHTWVGVTGIGLIVFIKTLAEEGADEGLPLFSSALDVIGAVLLLLGITLLLGVSAWHGWRRAGLVSLEFATLAGMSSFSMAMAAPFNRYDLALLAMPIGLIMSLLTYLNVRTGDLNRIISILVYGTMNIIVLLLIASAWNLPPRCPSPVVPFLVVLTGALLVGLVTGLLGRSVRRVIQDS